MDIAFQLTLWFLGYLSFWGTCTCKIIFSLDFQHVHLPHISIAPLKTKWLPKVSCNSINKICVIKYQHLQVSPLGVFGQKVIAYPSSL